jgi:hypothetical protein
MAEHRHIKKENLQKADADKSIGDKTSCLRIAPYTGRVFAQFTENGLKYDEPSMKCLRQAEVGLLMNEVIALACHDIYVSKNCISGIVVTWKRFQ